MVWICSSALFYSYHWRDAIKTVWNHTSTNAMDPIRIQQLNNLGWVLLGRLILWEFLMLHAFLLVNNSDATNIFFYHISINILQIWQICSPVFKQTEDHQCLIRYLSNAALNQNTCFPNISLIILIEITDVIWIMLMNETKLNAPHYPPGG